MKIAISVFYLSLCGSGRAPYRQSTSPYRNGSKCYLQNEHRMELKTDSLCVRQMPYRTLHGKGTFGSKTPQNVGGRVYSTIVVKREDSFGWIKGLRSSTFCVQYRRVKSATVHGSYLILRVEDCNGCLVFTTLDAKFWYWRTPMWDRDISLTAFSTYDG